MARQLGQSMSKIAAVVGCSPSAAVSIYEKWAKEGTVVNQGQSQWHPGPLMHMGREGWPVWLDLIGCQNAQSITVCC